MRVPRNASGRAYAIFPLLGGASMVNAVALPGFDTASSPHERVAWHHALSPIVSLLPPAILLGVLRVSCLTVAPKHGVYFTAEALLTVYACFAVTRAVHVNALSYDASERYDAGRAQRARQVFNRQLRRHWARIALLVLPLLVAALVADLLTAGTGIQQRLNIHLSIMFVELMAWWRYGPVIAIAAAQWTPPRPPSLARARWLARNAWLEVARALAPAHIFLSLAALSCLGVYGGRTWVRMFGTLPDARIVLGGLAALCAGLVWVALWSTCRGSLAVAALKRARAIGPRTASAAGRGKA
jgi:hypothetical protein